LFLQIDDNPSIHLHPSDLINSPHNIAMNDDVVAINSCIEIDLSGQVCSDTIGHRVYSGVGGQVGSITRVAVNHRLQWLSNTHSACLRCSLTLLLPFLNCSYQVDFERGAQLSPGGVPIIAVASRTGGGHARIVPHLKEGAGVVTSRAHVVHVVTEYGRVNLFGQTLRERARLLISIAHPDDREVLARYCRDVLLWKDVYASA
jgi:acyl-CoA hydrolase